MVGVDPAVNLYDDLSALESQVTSEVSHLLPGGVILARDTINKDASLAIGAVATNVSTRILEFIRTLFALAKEDSNIKLLLESITSMSQLPTKQEIMDYYDSVNKVFDELSNKQINNYNDWLNNLQDNTAAVAVSLGSEYVDAYSEPLNTVLITQFASPPLYGGPVATDINDNPVTFNSAKGALQALSDAFDAAVAQWHIDDDGDAFRATVQPLLDKAQTIYDALQLHSNLLASHSSTRGFDRYQGNVNDYIDLLNSVGDSTKQAWEQYNADASQIGGGFFPSPTLLPTDTFLNDLPTSYNAPGDPGIGDLSFPAGTGDPQHIIDNAPWGNAISRADKAISQMQDAANNFSSNETIFDNALALSPYGQLNMDPSSADYAGDDFYSQTIQTQFNLMAGEFSALLKAMTGLDNIDFLSLLKFLQEHKTEIEALSMTGAGSAVGTASRISQAGSKIDKIFALALARNLFEQTIYGDAYRAKSPISQEKLAELTALLKISGAIASVLGASVAFDQLTQLDVDLNNLSSAISQSVLSIDTAKLIGTSFAGFINTGFVNALRESAAARGMAVDEEELLKQAKELSDIYSKIILGQQLTVAAASAGLPASFMPTYLVDAHIKALIQDSTYSAQFLQDQQARDAQAARIGALFASFQSDLSYTAAGVGAGTAALGAAVANALTPLGVTEGDIGAITASLSEKLQAVQGALSLDQLKQILGSSLSSVLGESADQLAVNSLLVQLNRNQVDTTLLNDNIYARDTTLSDADKQVLIDNLHDLFRGSAEKNYIGYIETEGRLVNDGLKDDKALRLIAQDAKDHFDFDVLPPIWKYNQMLQEDGMKFLAMGLYMKMEGDNPVYTPAVRNAIQQPV